MRRRTLSQEPNLFSIKELQITSNNQQEDWDGEIKLTLLYSVSLVKGTSVLEDKVVAILSFEGAELIPSQDST